MPVRAGGGDIPANLREPRRRTSGIRIFRVELPDECFRLTPDAVIRTGLAGLVLAGLVLVGLALAGLVFVGLVLVVGAPSGTWRE